MKRIGLFVDSVNMYFTIKTHYNAALDYEKLYEYVKELGSIQFAGVYGLSRDEVSVKFRTKLKHLGFALNFDENPGSAITADIALELSNFDVLVVVTGDSELVSIVKRAQERGLHTIILGVKVSNAFRKYSSAVIEIPTTMCRAFPTPKTGGEDVHDVRLGDVIRANAGTSN
jgi:uncharacterized LabA/DUF88 family protein